jgi:hypothetical protein
MILIYSCRNGVTDRASLEFQPVVFPDRLSLFHKLTWFELKHTFGLECVIISNKHRRIAATTKEEIVVYDYINAKKVDDFPDFMKSAFKEQVRLQETEKSQARERSLELAKLVEQLEKNTWDRENAVEL